MSKNKFEAVDYEDAVRLNGDKCYYIHNNKNGWNLAIVEIVEFKAKTLIVKFVDVNPCEEYESKNYHGWYGEGDLSNPITPFTLIKVKE